MLKRLFGAGISERKVRIREFASAVEISHTE
jgi:hypothetical protein